MDLESVIWREVSQKEENKYDTTLMAESEEELKSLLTKVKEESEKANLKKKQRSWHPVPSLHGK